MNISELKMKTEKSKSIVPQGVSHVLPSSSPIRQRFDIFLSLGDFRGEFEQKKCRTVDIYNSDRELKRSSHEQKQIRRTIKKVGVREERRVKAQKNIWKFKFNFKSYNDENSLILFFGFVLRKSYGCYLNQTPTCESTFS